MAVASAGQKQRTIERRWLRDRDRDRLAKIAGTCREMWGEVCTSSNGKADKDAANNQRQSQTHPGLHILVLVHVHVLVLVLLFLALHTYTYLKGVWRTKDGLERFCLLLKWNGSAKPEIWVPLVCLRLLLGLVCARVSLFLVRV